MDFPFGHHHNHRDDDNSGDYPRPPYPPQAPFGGPFTHPPPPPQMFPPPGPPPPFGGPNYPPPSQATSVYHTSHTPPPQYGGSHQNYPPPEYGGPHSHHPNLESPNYPSFDHQSSSHGFGSGHESGGGTHSHHSNMESPNYPSYGHQTSSNELSPNYPSYDHQSSSHGFESGGGSRFKPHMPGFIAEHFHHSPSNNNDSSHGGGYDSSESGVVDLRGYFVNKPPVVISNKAGGNTYAVAIRDGKVILTYSDPNDQTQLWYKDEKFSTKVKDEDGYPSFALVNKATGQALKHSVSAQPVHLVAFKPGVLDESILWTESKDLGSGFRTIRMVNNVHLVLDAFNGDKDHGGIRDGTVIALFRPWKGDNQNQQWKLSPPSHA